MLAHQYDVDTPDVRLVTPLTGRSGTDIYSDLPRFHTRCDQAGNVISGPKTFVWRCYRHILMVVEEEVGVMRQVHPVSLKAL